METTKMYIELLIIGLESSLWMWFFYLNLLRKNISSFNYELLNNLSFSLIMLGIIYIIGVFIDRLSDMLFEKLEKSIRKNSELQTKTTANIWNKFSLENYAEYLRARIRILRASAINVPLITIGLLWYVWRIYQNLPLFLFILFVGLLFSFISCSGTISLMNSYYKKAHDLEQEININHAKI